MQNLIRINAFAKSGTPLLGVLKFAGDNITTSMLASITYQVFEKYANGPDLAVNSPLFVPAVVRDSIESWNGTPYNFTYTTDPTEIPEAGKTYLFEMKLIHTDGRYVRAVFEVDTLLE